MVLTKNERNCMSADKEGANKSQVDARERDEAYLSNLCRTIKGVTATRGESVLSVTCKNPTKKTASGFIHSRGTCGRVRLPAPQDLMSQNTLGVKISVLLCQAASFDESVGMASFLDPSLVSLLKRIPSLC